MLPSSSGDPRPLAKRGLAAWADRARHADDEEVDGSLCDTTSFARPTGEPAGVSCDEARTVVHQARTSIAAPVAPLDAAKFAVATSDWLDPHGLWSVAPDAPVGKALRRYADRLLTELEAAPGSGPCVASQTIGVDLAAWSTELRGLFDQGEREGLVKGRGLDLREAFRIASCSPFEDGPVTRSARDLARDLGTICGRLRAAYGAPLEPFVLAARRRTAPGLSAAAWAQVVGAAALRAYIPQLDAHGAWAPTDEEVTIYDLGLEADPPARLWTEHVRTALGVRVERGGLAPIAEGDLVLEVSGVALAGMSVEQLEQIAVVPQGSPAARVKVLRRRHPAPLELMVEPSQIEADQPETPAADLDTRMLRYGEGHAAVIQIPDVPDDLGDRLGVALDRARAARDLRGIVLDLRANGGGSTDGAMDALGIFLPGVALFPMRRRDGSVEVEHAPETTLDRRYAGPLAVLVDGDSASAAEMIAGGLWSYHRAVLVGDRTYGKGCAQEYLDDDAHTGMLRLTTLLFSLPDGSPLQKTGIVPNLLLSMPVEAEREARITRALGPWRGPDVRDPARIQEVPWPNHGGRVGPCHDDTLCRALRALGAARAAAR